MWSEEGLHSYMHILWQAPGSQVPRHNLQRLDGTLHLQAATNALRHTMHNASARLDGHRFLLYQYSLWNGLAEVQVEPFQNTQKRANILKCTPPGRPAWHLRAHPAALSAAGAAPLLHRQAPAMRHLVQQCAEKLC